VSCHSLSFLAFGCDKCDGFLHLGELSDFGYDGVFELFYVFDYDFGYDVEVVEDHVDLLHFLDFYERLEEFLLLDCFLRDDENVGFRHESAPIGDPGKDLIGVFRSKALCKVPYYTFRRYGE